MLRARWTAGLLVLVLAAVVTPVCSFVALPDVIGAGGPLLDALARRGIAGREIPVVKFGSVGAPLVRAPATQSRCEQERTSNRVSFCCRPSSWWSATFVMCSSPLPRQPKSSWRPGTRPNARTCRWHAWVRKHEGWCAKRGCILSRCVRSHCPALVFSSLTGVDVEGRPSTRLRPEVNSSRAFLSRKPPASYCQ